VLWSLFLTTYRFKLATPSCAMRLAISFFTQLSTTLSIYDTDHS
jgi:hypothetical protein